MINFKLNFLIKINIFPMHKRHWSEDVIFNSSEIFAKSFPKNLFSNEGINWKHWQHHNLNIIVHFLPLKFTNRTIFYAFCTLATIYYEQKILENLVCWIYHMTINHATANSLNIHQYSDSFLNQLKQHSVHTAQAHGKPRNSTLY